MPKYPVPCAKIHLLCYCTSLWASTSCCMVKGGVVVFGDTPTSCCAEAVLHLPLHRGGHDSHTDTAWDHRTQRYLWECTYQTMSHLSLTFPHMHHLSVAELCVYPTPLIVLLESQLYQCLFSMHVYKYTLLLLHTFPSCTLCLVLFVVSTRSTCCCVCPVYAGRLHYF